MLRQVSSNKLWLLSGVLVVLSICTATSDSVPPNCLNPNQNIGKCISIYDCASLSHVVRNLLEAQYRFVRLSQCAGATHTNGKTPFVCCTNDTDFNQPNGVEKERIIFPDMITTERTGSERPRVAFIEPPLCGALTISNKIYGGEDADVKEFTWLVQLEYKAGDGSIASECAGSLINERYVLTAAHCVTGIIEELIGKLLYLRVGDHSFSTEPCSEEDHPPHGHCVGIEYVVVHENYGANRDIRIREQNDIALIRMNKSVKFDEYIQPVCLPTAPLQKELFEGEVLTAVGWGHTGFSRHSSVKKKVDLPLYSLQHCRHVFQKYFYIAEEQLCAGGVFRQDSCTGDSGGPLMRLHSASWVIEGIVSFGRRGCGRENRPGIYTRVRNYIDWIAEHMEAW